MSYSIIHQANQLWKIVSLIVSLLINSKKIIRIIIITILVHATDVDRHK